MYWRRRPFRGLTNVRHWNREAGDVGPFSVLEFFTGGLFGGAVAPGDGIDDVVPHGNVKPSTLGLHGGQVSPGVLCQVVDTHRSQAFASVISACKKMLINLPVLNFTIPRVSSVKIDAVDFNSALSKRRLVFS